MSTADVNFVDADGESIFRIVRPTGCEGEITTAASKVLNGIKDTHGVSVRSVFDEESAENVAEIIIGETNREETKLAKQVFAAQGDGRINEYIICTINDDIVIYGATEESTVKGAEYFISTYVVNATIAGGINYLFKDSTGYETLGIAGTTRLCDVQFVRPIYNVSFLTQTETHTLLAMLTEKTGYKMTIVNDQIASTTGNDLDGSGTLTPTESKEYEVIIGNCVRDGVKTITDKNAYEIRVDGKKVYLNGGSPYATAMAVTEFTRILTEAKSVTADNNVLNGDYSKVIGNYDSAKYYRLTWADDFEGTEINTDLWDVRWGERAYAAEGEEMPCYRGNKELKNNYVEDGKLYFCAIQTDEARYGGLTTTQGMMEYYQGYCEISTLHPRGDGFWTALYNMSGTSPADKNTVGHLWDPERIYYTELDVEECYGAGNWAFGNTFVFPTSYGVKYLDLPTDQANAGWIHVNNRISSTDDRGYWMDFHTFGYEWLDKTQITYTCDGNIWCEQPLREGGEQLAYDQPVFMRLAMAAGTKNYPVTDDIDSWTKYNKYIVDYIHIYQHKGDKIYHKKLKEPADKWVETIIQ